MIDTSSILERDAHSLVGASARIAIVIYDARLAERRFD